MTKAISWQPESDDELSQIHERAAQTMGYSMHDTDLFQAREQYERRFPGPDGPERHLSELIRRSEKQTDESIALGKAGRK